MRCDSEKDKRRDKLAFCAGDPGDSGRPASLRTEDGYSEHLRLL